MAPCGITAPQKVRRVTRRPVRNWAASYFPVGSRFFRRAVRVGLVDNGRRIFLGFAARAGLAGKFFYHKGTLCFLTFH